MSIIAHLDMDAFFAAVEERNNPQWAGKPIVVGADPRQGRGRGVVSTANYAARKFGIHSAQPITQAWRLASPDTIFVPGNWSAYSSTSKRIMKIIKNALAPPLTSPRNLGGDTEGVNFLQTGVDECYFNLSFCKKFSEAEKICRAIKSEILTSEKLTCSIGLGPNKLVAKIAANFQKPDGLTVVPPEAVAAFLEPLSVRAIPGVGPKTEAILNKHGIKTIRNLRQRKENELAEMFGMRSPAPTLRRLVLGARGVGSTDLSESGPAKSISEQHTFSRDTRDPVLLTQTLREIAEHLIKQLTNNSYHTITVTVRFADFETHTSSHTLKQPTNALAKLSQEALRLLLPFLDHRLNPRGQAIRLVGLRLEKLS